MDATKRCPSVKLPLERADRGANAGLPAVLHDKALEPAGRPAMATPSTILSEFYLSLRSFGPKHHTLTVLIAFAPVPVLISAHPHQRPTGVGSPGNSIPPLAANRPANRGHWPYHEKGEGEEVEEGQ